MRITKFGHACVRFEDDGAVVVVDPGMFTSPEAVDGATAILLTHEHPDHVEAAHLRRTDAPIHTVAAVAETLPDDVRERVSPVTPGSRFDVGLPVSVVGEQHAVIHPELPRIANSGYLIEVAGTTYFHPGDALTVPDVPVDVLLLPVSAPWLKVSECIDYARAVGAPRNVAIHDKIYSDAGLAIVGGHLTRFLGAQGLEYSRVEPGSEV